MKQIVIIAILTLGTLFVPTTSASCDISTTPPYIREEGGGSACPEPLWAVGCILLDVHEHVIQDGWACRDDRPNIHDDINVCIPNNTTPKVCVRMESTGTPDVFDIIS